MASAHPIILFDGICNLCNAWVVWLAQRDRQSRFRFASLQSKAAQAAVEAAGTTIEALPDSIVLIDADGLHVRSTAALRILRQLRFPYAAAGVLLFVPRIARDAIYKLIARHRYRWFGRRDVCMRPTPELSARFLDAQESPGAAPRAEHSGADCDTADESCR